MRIGSSVGTVAGFGFPKKGPSGFPGIWRGEKSDAFNSETEPSRRTPPLHDVWLSLRWRFRRLMSLTHLWGTSPLGQTAAPSPRTMMGTPLRVQLWGAGVQSSLLEF